MELLAVEEYIAFLKAEFDGVDPELLEGLFLNAFDLDVKEVHRAEDKLGIQGFPISFTELVKKYDFGNFRIINTQFGYDDTGSLDWLLERNNAEQYGLDIFIKELRENSLILVANGDPFAILMSIETGSIFAIDAERTISERILVANSFEKFVEGMATGFLAKRRNRIPEFLELARVKFGSEAIPFWQEAVL